MPDLNLDLDYFGHPKTRRLVGLLGRASEVLPIRLWCYCGKYHAENGRLTGYSAQEIEAAIDWWGKDGECVKAMVQVGMLDLDGDTYVVHGWTEHAGHIAALKEHGRKAAEARWAKYRGNAAGNARALQEQYHNLPTNQPSLSPSVEGEEKELTGEDKIKATVAAMRATRQKGK